jgi:hypothetical protein
MSENAPEPAAEEAAEAAQEFAQEFAQEIAEPERTGVEEVDAVLESVEGLEGTPVDEHVAVFESAHERLRGALDTGGDA